MTPTIHRITTEQERLDPLSRWRERCVNSPEALRVTRACVNASCAIGHLEREIARWRNHGAHTLGGRWRAEHETALTWLREEIDRG